MKTKATAAAAAAKLLQLCPTLWDPIDSSPPGSSVHGILLATTLEWFAISISFSNPTVKERHFLELQRPLCARACAQLP